MDNYTATELAYKNGYEQGKKDAVKHGRWIPLEWRPKCSICGFGGSLYDTPINPFKYCPNCGAKMDGGET